MSSTKLLSLFLSFCLILEQSVFAQTIDLSHYFVRNPAQTVPQSDKFRPLHLRYISYDSQANDFKLLLDKGDFFNQQTPKLSNSSNPKLKEATQELMKYFFIGLALPNEKFWVNLRPDSPDNILDPDLEKTDIGRIFLEADLQLKKDTSGMTSPQTKEGKEYWDKLYKKAGELFGAENITIPTITRPWIVPDEVIIRESPEGAYIYKATLKVMLEEDYLRETKEDPSASLGARGRGTTINYSFNDPRLKELNEYSTRLIKEAIIPRLTKEINSARRYAPLRQVYYSLILAQWFKEKYGSLGSPRAPGARATVNNYIDLIDSGNLASITSNRPYDKQTYFQQYQKSFKDGEYNLQEPVYTPMGQSIRRYMSGGIKGFASSSAAKIPGKGEMPRSNFLTPFLYVGKLVKTSLAILKPVDGFNPKQKEIIKDIINTYKSYYPSLLGNVVSEDIINDMRMTSILRNKLLSAYNLIIDNASISVAYAILWFSFTAVAGVISYEYLRSAYLSVVVGAFSVLSAGGMTYAYLKHALRDFPFNNPVLAGWIDMNDDKIYIFPERVHTIGEFVRAVAHELTHKFYLPNDNLLANAYAAIFSSDDFDVPNKVYTALDAIMRFGSGFAQEEAILRRIVSDNSLSAEFFDAADKEERSIMNRILNEASLTLDYNMPRPRSERNMWIYTYGYLLGMLVYFECGHNFNKSMNVLIKLGMVRDIRDVDVEKIINSSVDSWGNVSSSLSLKSDNSTTSLFVSSAVEKQTGPSDKENVGGIDLSRINKSIRTEGVDLHGVGGGGSPVDVDFDLNEELSQLQKLLNAEIVPSADRLNRYARAACSSSLSSPDTKDSALSLVAETFRLQENKAAPAVPELKDLAAWLEQGG